MTKAIMVQGTGSGVGKSLLVAGLCRIFRERGVRVAPFKAQNMALNSFITVEGGEIGRAQAFQAEAAGIEPSTDMNPILLKTTGETGCQVIVNGRVHGNMQAREYYAFKNEAWDAVARAYARLADRYELILIEGAGSPAEINLAAEEVVNMRVARHAKAPVILVGDIDKGGVFASLYGTVALLDGDGDLIKAFVINKFRGDRSILDPGLAMIGEKTGRPVIGVLPYLGDMGLHEEDGIPLDRLRSLKAMRPVRIVVLRLKSISNFTDFDPFLYEPDVDLVYSLRPADIENADLIVIPGSKNTVNDLLRLREAGVEACVKRAAGRGVPVIGICGGYQMLGSLILDPHGVESAHRTVEGMGLLDITTTFDRVKTTRRVEAAVAPGAKFLTQTPLRGYEIHMGRSAGSIGLFRIAGQEGMLDGSAKESVWGTYLHGIFDNDAFRRELIDSLRIRAGHAPRGEIVRYGEERSAALDRWAGVLQEHLDMGFIERLAGL